MYIDLEESDWFFVNRAIFVDEFIFVRIDEHTIMQLNSACSIAPTFNGRHW